MMTARIDSDGELVQSLRDGAPGAAEQLVDAYGERIYRLAVQITGVRGDAEEVARDALWTAAREIHMFKGAAAFGSWLYRIAANAAHEKLRARRGRPPELPWEQLLPALDEAGRHFEAMDDWSPRVDEHALQGELREVLTTAIEGLPPDYRTAFVMHDMEGRSNPEITATLGISLPAVKSRVHRSRLFLRQRLADYMTWTSEQSRS
ncbi:MAG: RNA polymerase subunit sigma-24 [Candidatus Rokuibacteriota bacterium]|nr:MAG: RNA polymerase subunit sigma-24 [Candidatus Rokubacteria bacterium]